MTRINWDEVHQLKRLDEVIAYSIVTLEEAYTAPNNDDMDSVTKNDASSWVRWEIAYDDQGRAFFRYGASLYVKDRHPLGDADFLSLINSPTRWLVNHAAIGWDVRKGDTSLEINTLADIPEVVTTMEQLLFWAIVLGDWWNRVLKYLASLEIPEIPNPTPIGSWGDFPLFPSLQGEENGSIDAQFDAYNGAVDDLNIPDFLRDILDDSSRGTGDLTQSIDLPSKDAGNYRENLVTCEEQDPNIKNFSQQQLEALLPTK
jgi:hypothetical protein